MERTAKLVVLSSLIASVAVQAMLVSRTWPAAWEASIVAFGLGVALNLAVGEIAASIALVFSFVYPAAVIVAIDRLPLGSDVVWMAAILGTIAPAVARSGWNVPRAWRAALVLWACTVAIAWPIVLLREIDFGLISMDTPRLANSMGGATPISSALIVAKVAATLGIGILWFDWLYLTFARAPLRFRRRVIAPLSISWLAAIGVAVYQLSGDLRFVSWGPFASLGRATASMGDANAFGAVAAIWSASTFVLLLNEDSSRHWWLGSMALGLSWVGVWASGSRTAFIAAIVVLASVIWSGWQTSRTEQTVSWKPIATGVFVFAVLATIGLWLDSPAIGPVRRLFDSLPSPTVESISVFIIEMWRRGGYGTVAVSMIGQHPLSGVGVGAYYTLLSDYATAFHLLLPTDNAQNWFRHQLAEFGIVGSVGWMLWTVAFGWFVLKARASQRSTTSLGILKGALCGLTLISLVGMPTQNVAVTLTFWTLSFWIWMMADQTRPAADTGNVIGRRTWIAMALVLAPFVIGTGYAARHDLRVPVRAARLGRPYAYGFYGPESTRDGRSFRWTQQHAVAVLPVPKPWMRIRVSANHRDLAERPMDVWVWCDRRIVVATTLRTKDPVTEYVRLPDGQHHLVLETRTSRVSRPIDFGVPDRRELGVMIDWSFEDEPSRASMDQR